jgi:predicted secreted hydrolase
VNAFRFRKGEDGNVQASVGVSRPDGSQAIADDIELTPQGYWTSPHTGIRYPTSWHLVVPERKLDLELTPTLQDQEMKGLPPHSYPKLAPIPTYWEGSMHVVGTVDGKPVNGRAYGEFVGYGTREDQTRLDPDTIALAREKAEQATHAAEGYVD